MDLKPDTGKHADRLRVFRKTPINGQVFKKLIEASLAWLRTNQQIVNTLNVFPVPDGDTGTNMVLTMLAASEEISNSSEPNFGKIAHSIANGALMGARGNSGVILSQLWRGFARALNNQEILDGPSFVQALIAARDTAYKGVVRPVEGTILTVAKDMAAAGEIALKTTNDPIEILEQVVKAADVSVQNTPELLPVLKEAGVVDAGGKGLFFILEGILRYTQGLPLETPAMTVQPLGAMQLQNTLAAIEPGQDYEWVIDFQPVANLNLESFYNDLEQMGTSIQIGEGDGIYRLHIHMSKENKYKPIEYMESIGTFFKGTLENLQEQIKSEEAKKQRQPLALAPIEPGQIAVVSVAPGDGIARVFASMGAAGIVSGGQTMNPSTQEILNAFENLPTDRVIILPNNKNIIRTAQAASELTVKKVAVIPSKSIPQGLAAMIRLIPHGDLEQVVASMNKALEEVQTGEITYATRSVEIDGVAVQEGHYIGLLNGKLMLSSPNLDQVCLGLLEKAHTQDYEIITLFSGMDVPKPEVNRMADLVRSEYPDQEIELQEGGQPHYYFIISIE